MAEIIAVANQKGGVAKTTTVINLGAALALRGKKVLLIDTNPQANCTTGLGIELSQSDPALHTVITSPESGVKEIICETTMDNLYLVPSHINLSAKEQELYTQVGGEADKLEKYKQEMSKKDRTALRNKALEKIKQDGCKVNLITKALINAVENELLSG
ncbi:AAA family ATPase [Candidatus Poribacteria bacterium]|nr:AAA family ATPase [Candidatus Poribacteria bacterium]